MRGQRPIRGGLAFAAALAALLAFVAPASAGRLQESIFQDDRVLASSDLAQQARALDNLALLGVDTIHTVVNWRRMAPQPASKTVPQGFVGTDSRSYGSGVWDPYDALVRGAQARGMQVLMSPSGPIPDWASRCATNSHLSCKPDPAMYADFVTAIASRYSGAWRDENQDALVLPRVARWGIWNEPNLGAWLYPQTQRVRGSKKKRVPVGAAQYRRLFYAARGALDATGHGGDQVLVGETAPLGGGATRTPPADFLRQLFCIDARGRPLRRGKVAKQLGCVKAKRIVASGLSHHPYARGAGVPTSPKQRRGAITMGTLGRLVPIVRAATKRSRVAPRKLPVYLTEFGVSTNPPDPKFGVTPERQAQYLNLVDYLAFKRPWVKSVAQFVLEDDARPESRNVFQTGLMTASGERKPSFRAYRMPIFVVKRGARAEVFGQVRPARGGAVSVEIQQRPPRGAWQTALTRTTNARGYVLAKLRHRRGSEWRLRWVAGDGRASYSRAASAVPPTTRSTPGLPPPGPGTPPQPAPPSTDPSAPQPEDEEPPTPTGAIYALTVDLELQSDLLYGEASGRVTSSPGGIDCSTDEPCAAGFPDSTFVTLTAVPGQGTTFRGWGGGVCGGTEPCTLTMSQARSVTASFQRTGF